MNSPTHLSIAPNRTTGGLCFHVLGKLALFLFAAFLIQEQMKRGDAGDFLTVVIVVGGMIGVLIVIAGLSEIITNKDRLNRVMQQLEGKEVRAYLFEQSNNPDPLVCVIRNLYIQFQHNPGAVNADGQLRILHRRLGAFARRTKKLGLLLISLGLVGTCIGLIGTLDGLALVVENSQGGGPEFIQKLFGAGGPLAGLGGAFTTTLAGIACGGIGLRLLAGALQTAADDLVDRFDEYVSVYVIPALSGSSKEGRHEQ